METREIAPGIVLYSNVHESYKEIVKDLEESVDSKIVSWRGAYVKVGEEVKIDINSRDTQTISIPYSQNPEIDSTNFFTHFESSVSSLFYNIFNPIEKDYLNRYNLNLDWHDVYAVLKYGKGQKFTNHVDDHKELPRRVSIIYYLNDEYTGGEINFPRFGITYKPKANEMILFPSTYVYNHSVSPVLSGNRYAVVSWLN